MVVVLLVLLFWEEKIEMWAMKVVEEAKCSTVEEECYVEKSGQYLTG